jgi:hypothetical protein
MSSEAHEYWRLARQAKEAAEHCEDARRGLMQAIGEAYVVLARVQETLDDKHAVYVSRQPH